MKTCKQLVATAAATLLLLTAAGAASARNLSISNLGWRATFNTVELRFSFGTIRCQLSLEGSFHTRTMAKVRGALAGYVTRATGGPCAAGQWRYLEQTLPWHVRYRSFSGTLPNISNVIFDVVGLAFQYREPFNVFTCLFRSTEAQPLNLWFSRASGTVSSVSAVGTIGGSGEPCEGINAELNGTSSTAVNEAGSRITLTLI